MNQREIRCGYPAAAGDFFEAPPHPNWIKPYPLGIPNRLLASVTAMNDLFGCVAEPPAKALTTVHGIAQMTDADKRVLAAQVDKPLAVQLNVAATRLADQITRDLYDAACAKIVEADRHACEIERKLRGVD